MAQITINTPYQLNPGERMELHWRFLESNKAVDTGIQRLEMNGWPDRPDLLTVHTTIPEGEHDVWFTFVVLQGDRVLRRESPIGHRCICVLKANDSYNIHALWRVSSPLNVLAQPPFNPIDPTSSRVQPLRMHKHGLITEANLMVTVHYTPDEDEEIRLCGSSKELGHWDPNLAPVMIPHRTGLHLTLALKEQAEYKFVRRTQASGSQPLYEWEEGPNRTLLPVAAEHTHRLSELEPPLFAQPSKRTHRRLLGTVLPLFSLRTDHSMGCGDLSDAIAFVDRLAAWGQQLFQILPINDTTFRRTKLDSYPYNSITTYGIHPMYMDVRLLPYFNQAKQGKAWDERGRELNASPVVLYEETMALKEEIIEDCFERWFQTKGYELPDFRTFVEEDRDSLVPYALFCAWRDEHPGVRVQDYPPYNEVLAKWQKQAKNLNDSFTRSVLYYMFMQQQLFGQLADLHSHAQSKGVLLKGDLPIGVGYNSVDAWHYPEIFKLSTSAGAPPDAFSPEGQQWGFPTYDWEAMKRKGYAWWGQRLGVMQRYFDAMRIDHILGFFRIWTIPIDPTLDHNVEKNNPQAGYFVPANGLDEGAIRQQGFDPEGPFFVKAPDGKWHPHIMLYTLSEYQQLNETEQLALRKIHDDYFFHDNEMLWQSTAMERLQAIRNSTHMLLCAEDLGMLPSTVRKVLDQFEIFSLEVVRMPKYDGVDFVTPDDVPLLSVLTTSTHDMSTLRGWWHSLSDEMHDRLARTYRIPLQAGPEALIVKLLGTKAAMVILPLQDWCTFSGYGREVPADQEQINKPDDPRHIWNYRMYGTVEELANDHELTKKLLEQAQS